MKLKRFIALVIVALTLTLCLAACGNNSVNGNTYQFDSVEIKWTQNATDVEKAAFLVVIAGITGDDTLTVDTALEALSRETEKYSNGSSFSFKDGKVTSVSGDGASTEGTYEQNGKEVKIKIGAASTVMTSEGGKLTFDINEYLPGNENAPITGKVIYSRK